MRRALWLAAVAVAAVVARPLLDVLATALAMTGTGP